MEQDQDDILLRIKWMKMKDVDRLKFFLSFHVYKMVHTQTDPMLDQVGA